MLPIKGEYSITAVFGQTGKYWADRHKGIDFYAEHKNIYAVTGGSVRVCAFDKDGWGLYLSIGDSTGNRHLYCHLEKALVKTGEKVKCGQVIGIMGKTGNVTGVHLHYQINNSAGVALDPSKYLGIPNKVGEYGGEFMYKDDRKIANWAKDAVYEAREKGYLVGDSDGNFRPTDPLSRQEAAVLIRNFERKLQNDRA